MQRGVSFGHHNDDDEEAANLGTYQSPTLHNSRYWQELCHPRNTNQKRYNNARIVHKAGEMLSSSVLQFAVKTSFDPAQNLAVRFPADFGVQKC